MLQKDSILSKENLDHFNNALCLLHNARTEMRRAAYSLIPENFADLGLYKAMNDFIGQFSRQAEPAIILIRIGENLRFDNELEILTYQITRKLIINAMEHAKAKKIVVDLFFEPKHICIRVTDDGVGFNPPNTSPENTPGNISERISSHNGRFNIKSEPDKGTECMLEFLLS
jgi:signal transduction histidine kinase